MSEKRVGQKSEATIFEDTFSAYIFKKLQRIYMIFDTLQRRFILIISIDSKSIKFIKQSGAT